MNINKLVAEIFKKRFIRARHDDFVSSTLNRVTLANEHTAKRMMEIIGAEFFSLEKGDPRRDELIKAARNLDLNGFADRLTAHT